METRSITQAQDVQQLERPSRWMAWGYTLSEKGTLFLFLLPALAVLLLAHWLDDGLFEKFPAERVFGMHNFHDIPAGHFAVKAGPMMASFDSGLFFSSQ